MIKRTRLEIFAISIVDNLCLLQQNKWNTINIRLPRSIINALYGSNFVTIRLDFSSFSSVAEKTGRCREVFCGSWVRAVVAVVIVERFK